MRVSNDTLWAERQGGADILGVQSSVNGGLNNFVRTLHQQVFAQLKED